MHKLKKFTLALLLTLILATSTVGSLAWVQPAQATLPVTIIESVPAKTKDILDQIYTGLKTAALNAAVRVVAYAMRKIAYDSAVWLASGGKGQTPFANTRTFGDYMKNTADEAFGKGIEELGKPYGLNLCQIPDIRADLKLKVGLRLDLAPTQPSRKPTCSFTAFRENWLDEEKWKSQYGDTKSLAERFNASVTLDDSDLGIQLDASQKIDQLVLKERAGAELQRIEGQGYIPKTTLISNQIQTPAGILKKDFERNTPGDQQEKDEQQIAAALSQGNIQVIPTVLNIFLNTLASTMARNFQEKGVLPFGICVGDYGGESCKGSGDVAAQYAGLGVVGGRRAAEELFTGFLETVNIAAVEEYDVLADLSNCPDVTETYHCRADQRLVEAAKRADAGNPVTIAQAIKDDMLHGSWQLIPPTRSVDDTDKNCFKDKYCYSNIKVLRQLRLLPLGFEVAAKYSDPDRPWTLKQVVGTPPHYEDGFNNCRRDPAGNIVYDPVNFPFCHLIDPNWVIKVAPMRCNARVYGPVPLSGGVPDRLQECADLASCVAYTGSGSKRTCTSFGYCTREKNTWRFDADNCESQYATCRSYTDADGKPVAYLYRTLDTGFCTQDNVGCRYYSLIQDAAGKWLPPSVNPTTYRNNGIHFNGQLSTCSTNSAGCSAFTPNAEDARNLLHYRKAPDYLGCYDAKPDAANPGVQWPANRADLRTIKGQAACKNYADVCIPEEVGCNLYTPVAGSGTTAVPGKYGPGDVCDAKCVGYDSYRESISNYSNGQNLAYIIPASGRQCKSVEAGCSSFTNLSTDAGGVEKVEHFTYLRPCIKPDTTKQKNFTTYERSSSGFQLKIYTLVKDTDGSPKYFYRTTEDIRAYGIKCNEIDYKAGKADPDCRQFNDEQGNVYYKLLGKTIAVSDQCTPYRLNNTELYDLPGVNAQDCVNTQKGYWSASTNQCQVCFQGGEYRDGSCFYEGLPDGITNTAGNSDSCSASADTCREYKGNTGNNVAIKIQDDFEGDESKAMEGWSGTNGQVRRAPESTRTDGYSVGSNGASTVTRSVELIPGKSYDLTFWAKGSGTSVEVALTDQNNQKSSFGSVAVNDTWNYYRVGPIEFVSSAATTSGQLTFTVQAGTVIFLDNVKLVEVTDYIYLVKNSLRVDSVCDSNLNDNLPGEALGCTAYKDLQGRPVALTNFSTICRENAIGCTALFDLQNTPNNRGPELRQVWLAGTGGSTLTLTYQSTKVGECRVEVSQQGCYVKSIMGIEPADLVSDGAINADAARKPQIVASTVYIPADTRTSTPIHLVANQAASCNAVDLGCVNAGVAVQTPSGVTYSTTTIKNDPATYDKTLCQSEALGCSAYSDSDGAVYFKDPAVTGQKICAYQKDAVVSNNKVSGWFWKGVQMCGGTNTICTKDSDCAAGKKCEAAPCYPNYFTGGTYGLWSYGDAGKYDNFVGECPASADKCTEFIDHNANDFSYFFLKNDRIDTKTCNQQVSQKEGCALFDQADVPAKLWSTRLTYQDSNSKDGQLVPPNKGAPADANIIIKVKQDRECGEWLQCRSSHRVWDDVAKKWKSVCDEIGRCNQAADSTQTGDVTNCGNWLEGPADNTYANQLLTPDVYVSRDVSWKGMDFDGYSVLGVYPLEELDQVNVSNSAEIPNWRLVKEIPCGTNCAASVRDPNTESACKSATTSPGCGQGGEFNEPCTVSTCGRNNEGVCLNGTCVQNINGVGRETGSRAPKHICRAFPEPSSPFPFTRQISTNAKNFGGVNLCSESAQATGGNMAFACECDYTKVTYGDLFIKYWSYNNPNRGGSVPQSTAGSLPHGICQSTDPQKDGISCFNDTVCGVGGTCQRLKKESQHIGWRGFCVEEDLSRTINGDRTKHPCLTWFPVDTLIGAADINNQHEEAGYRPPTINNVTGGRYYCLNSNAVTGSTDPANFEISTVLPVDFYGNTEQFESTANIDPGSTIKAIQQQDIQKIIFEVNGGDAEDPPRATQFEIWPNDPSLGQQTSYEVKPIGAHQQAFAVTGRYMGRDNEFILIYGTTPNEQPTSRAYVDDKGNVCYPAVDGKRCESFSGNAFTGNFTTNGGGTQLQEGIWDPGVVGGTTNLCPAKHLDGSNNSGDGNWHAVRIRFDPNTRNLKYFDTAYCDQSELQGKIEYRVKFVMKQWCALVADTQVSYGAGRNTIAWTDRLWQQSKNPFTVTNIWPNTKESLNYTYATPQAPFGSLESFAQGPNAQATLVQIGTPRDPLNSSVACELTGGGQAIECKCPSSAGLTKCSYYITDQGYTSGAPYSCGNGSTACISNEDSVQNKLVPSKAGQYTKEEGKYNLGRLFAQVKEVFRFDPPTLKYILYSSPIPSDPFEPFFNYTETGDKHNNATSGKTPSPPKIYPVGECFGEDRCIEDRSKEGFTVNGTTESVRIFSGNNRVFLRFFGFADPDQMPLRKITIDWGDGNTIPYEGQYRNHRGYLEGKCETVVGGKECRINGTTIRQDPNDATSPPVECQSDNDCPRMPQCFENGAKDFGSILDQTCNNNYFEFEHTYQCTQATTTPATSCPAGFEKGCCIFEPKVQMKDNWKWCTGKCTGRSNGGCYDGQQLIPKKSNECDEAEAWIPFGQKIFVAPK